MSAPQFAWPRDAVSADQIRDPGEKTAGLWMWLFAVPALIAVAVYSVITFGLLPLFFFGVGRLTQLLILAHFKLNGVRVSAQQFPILDQAADNFSQRLGIERPDVYVVQETMFNAFAARLAGRHIVVLFSGAIDSVLRTSGEGDLAFVLGHELGHIAAGHVSFLHSLQAMGGWFIWVGLWYRRRMELTCDRIGLALVGDPELALRAMAHITVGAELAPLLNFDAAAAQLREHEGEFFVKYRTIYSLYPSQLYRLENLREAARFVLPRPAPVLAMRSGEGPSAFPAA